MACYCKKCGGSKPRSETFERILVDTVRLKIDGRCVSRSLKFLLEAREVARRGLLLLGQRRRQLAGREGPPVEPGEEREGLEVAQPRWPVMPVRLLHRQALLRRGL